MMKTIKGRSLVSAGYAREFIFESPEAMKAYLKTIRGEYYILKQSNEGVIKAVIVASYNDTPIIKL